MLTVYYVTGGLYPSQALLVPCGSFNPVWCAAGDTYQSLYSYSLQDTAQI